MISYVGPFLKLISRRLSGPDGFSSQYLKTPGMSWAMIFAKKFNFFENGKLLREINVRL